MFPKNRAPITAGETLDRTFMQPLEMSCEELSAKTSLTIREIKSFISGQTPCTVEIAILLSDVFGTVPSFWMSVQQNHDMWSAHQAVESISAN